LERNLEPGEDKFLGIWESTTGNIQMDYGERIGLGRKDYQLEEV